MRFSRVAAACVVAVGVATAGAVRADDSDLRREPEALQRRIAVQERRLRTLDNAAPIQEEPQVAVARRRTSRTTTTASTPRGVGSPCAARAARSAPG